MILSIIIIIGFQLHIDYIGDETPLEKILGSSSVLKILDVLVTHPSMDYSKKDLAEASEVAETTVHRSLDKIEGNECRKWISEVRQDSAL
ncbi:MAG: hypothetical protein V5A72_01225 [Candidatus Nanohaloarchaea archaeon]